MSVVVNYLKFYEDLNKARKARGIAWNKVATRAGIAASGMAVFVRQFEDPGSPAKALSLENFFKLLDWLKKTDVSSYMIDEDAVNGNIT